MATVIEYIPQGNCVFLRSQRNAHAIRFHKCAVRTHHGKKLRYSAKTVRVPGTVAMTLPYLELESTFGDGILATDSTVHCTSANSGSAVKLLVSLSSRPAAAAGMMSEMVWGWPHGSPFLDFAAHALTLSTAASASRHST